MPYIKEEKREELDPCIDNLIKCLDPEKDLIISNILGDINYTFSRILGGLMGTPSYNKIAMITGVLENIKQEFYRRVAESYEDKKILENGDIKEYKKLS
jgi:hypothetical protein